MRLLIPARTIICQLFLFSLFLPAWVLAETRTWTGYGGDSYWSNPLNWSGQTIPLPTDDVLLDNGDLPVSYQVILPDTAVILKTIQINPSPGRNIELILPATNHMTDAFSVTGPGYGIELNAGAIFRNASGLSSGESLLIADSMIIRDGARYIHQTRASHANSILKFLSTAPGTEEGIFDFDVPKAAYTISVSNRIYGSLELHSSAYGDTVNYTCTGANPLLIHGNFRMGSNVFLNMNLSGTNGNIQVLGDFIQEGGRLNLSGGGTNNTVLRVKGDLYQSPEATITETTNGNPFLELNGSRLQEIAMAGQILNQVGFRMNNMNGARLRLTLVVPWKLELIQGIIYSSSAGLLILDSLCSIGIDSSLLTGSCVDGPLRKIGLAGQDHFLFPVGKDGNLRWLELKEASGNYLVEYMHQNPASVGMNLGTGLDHISKLEYWQVVADGLINIQAKIELSYASVQSGGVTDPDYLNVARFYAEQWEDAGHTAVTGNAIQGSVLSSNTDFTSTAYTLASTIDLENPLPLTILKLNVNEISGKPVFTWTVSSPEIADHFDLYEVTGNQPIALVNIPAVNLQSYYTWTDSADIKSGDHYFRIRMTDNHGKEYAGNIVRFKTGSENTRLSWLPAGNPGGSGQVMIRSSSADTWNYEIITISGCPVEKGIIQLNKGKNYLVLHPDRFSTGFYIFRGFDAAGKNYSLLFKND